MTAASIAERIRVALLDTIELSKTDPDGAEQIVRATVATLRTLRPEAVSCLSDWPPTETPTDPRRAA